VPGKKMMGYKKGGSLDMVEKDGKKVPFYAADGKGKMAEGGKVKTKGYKKGGEVDPNRKKFLEQMNADNEKSKNATAKRLKDAKESDKKSTARSTPTAEEIQARKDAEMDKNMRGAAAKFGMKAGGKVKKKAKSYGHGGKVRGAGIAKKGVKKCKMR